MPLDDTLKSRKQENLKITPPLLPKSNAFPVFKQQFFNLTKCLLKISYEILMGHKTPSFSAEYQKLVFPFVCSRIATND